MPKGHLKSATEMIDKMGYHRWDLEIEELQLQIANDKLQNLKHLSHEGRKVFLLTIITSVAFVVK